VLDVQCHNLLGEETPQLYALCGAGPRSTLRVLRQAGAYTRPLLSSTGAVSDTQKHPTHPKHPLTPL